MEIPRNFNQFSTRPHYRSVFSILPVVLWNTVAEYAADTPWHTLRSIVLVQYLNTEHAPRILLEHLVKCLWPVTGNGSNSTNVDTSALLTAVIRDPSWVQTLLCSCDTIGKLLRPMTSPNDGWLSPSFFMGILCRKGLVDTVDTSIFDGLPEIRTNYSSGTFVGIDQEDMRVFDIEGLPVIIPTENFSSTELQQVMCISSYVVQYDSLGSFRPEGAVKVMKVHDMLIRLVLSDSFSPPLAVS